MVSSLRLLGIFVCSFAVFFCLATCSVPELFTASKTTERCHTEKENPSEPQQQEFCCSGEAILSSGQTSFFSMADAQPLMLCSIKAVDHVPHRSRSIDFH